MIDDGRTCACTTSLISPLVRPSNVVGLTRPPRSTIAKIVGCLLRRSYAVPARVWLARDLPPCRDSSISTSPDSGPSSPSVRSVRICLNSKLGLDKWLPAVWLAANSKNGISSHELARSLGITQKSAWFVMHRIRLAMQTESFLLSGEVEVDETFVGGKAKNMHRSVRERKGMSKGGGASDKTIVLGMRERGGKVHAEVIPAVDRATLQKGVRGKVETGSTVYTDQNPGYNDLRDLYDHATVNHIEIRRWPRPHE